MVKHNSKNGKPQKSWLKGIKKNLPMMLFILPALSIMIINNFLPMFGLTMAFRRMDNTLGIFRSPWTGFDNFHFLFGTGRALTLTRNTVLYNLAFILLGLIVSVSIAIMLNELKNRVLAKMFQTIIIMPFFLSFVVIGYIVFSFLSPQLGFFNTTLLPFLGMEARSWYSTLHYWPFILTLVHILVFSGVDSIIYSASISGIDQTMYEAAVIDGAGKWAQIRHITLPLLGPVISVLTILKLGNIMRGNFGLFYQVPLANPILIPATDVLDTFIYRSLSTLGDFGMVTAASLYQSVLGAIVILTANYIIGKINPDNAMF